MIRLTGGSEEVGGVEIVSLGADLAGWALGLAGEHFGSARIATRGRLHDLAALPCLAAVTGGEPVGYLAYWVDGADCEIVALVSTRPRQGVARALIDALDARVGPAGVTRVVLVTTNDNLPAQQFYRACGFRLVATHEGAVTASRRLKPEIPLTGVDGVAIEDELEYERRL